MSISRWPRQVRALTGGIGDNRHHRPVTHSWGGRTDVPGRPENGDQMGGLRPHRLDPHSWRTPQVPRVRSQRSAGRSFRRRIPIDRLAKVRTSESGKCDDRTAHAFVVLGQVAHRAPGGLVAVPIRMAANRDSRPVSTGLGAHCRVYGHLTAPRPLNRRLCLTVTPVVAVPRAERRILAVVATRPDARGISSLVRA